MQCRDVIMLYKVCFKCSKILLIEYLTVLIFARFFIFENNSMKSNMFLLVLASNRSDVTFCYGRFLKKWDTFCGMSNHKLTTIYNNSNT